MARIALVTTSYPIEAGDPAGHFVASEARRLALTGDRVTVLAAAPDRAPANDKHADATAPFAREQRGNLDVCWISGGEAFGAPGVIARLRARPLRTWSVVRFIWNTRRALGRLGPFDCTIVHFLLPVAPLCKTRGTSFEVVVHGSDLGIVEKLGPVAARLLLHGLKRQGTKIRCVSQDLRRRLLDIDPELREHSYVEPCALDLEYSLTRARAREKLGIDQTQRVIVIVGRLISSKRIGVALEAARLTTARTIVIGDGPEKDVLKRAFPFAEFLGALPHEVALSWISAATLVLSASEREGAPTVVREARALGSKVVARAAGDLRLWSEDDAGLWSLDPDGEL